MDVRMSLKKKEEGKMAHVGLLSLLLIFIVLCLAVFGVLALSSAAADGRLAQKNVDKVQAYYTADGKGEEWIKEVNEKIVLAAAAAENEEDYEAQLKEIWKEHYDGETGIISCLIPVGKQQGLSIGLERAPLKTVASDKKNYRIESWVIVNTQDYVTDDSIRVWPGGE